MSHTFDTYSDIVNYTQRLVSVLKTVLLCRFPMTVILDSKTKRLDI